MFILQYKFFYKKIFHTRLKLSLKYLYVFAREKPENSLSNKIFIFPKLQKYFSTCVLFYIIYIIHTRSESLDIKVIVLEKQSFVGH